MDGKALAERIRRDVAREISELDHVGLATVLVGADPASEVYIRLKHKATLEVGIAARDLRLPASTSEAELLSLVADHAADRIAPRSDRLRVVLARQAHRQSLFSSP